MAGQWAIRVTTQDGDDMYLREGERLGVGTIARFNRRDAHEQAEFLRMGMDDGETVSVIPFSSVPADELLEVR